MREMVLEIDKSAVNHPYAKLRLEREYVVFCKYQLW